MWRFCSLTAFLGAYLVSIGKSCGNIFFPPCALVPQSLAVVAVMAFAGQPPAWSLLTVTQSCAPMGLWDAGQGAR